MKRTIILCLFLFLLCLGSFADSPGVHLTEGVVYKQVDGTSLKLDIYHSDPDGKLHPVLVYIHGGSWMFGDNKEVQRGFPRDLCLCLLKEGYSVVSVEYRLISKDNSVCFPEPLSDCKDAVRWVRKMAGKYDFDINRIIVGGGSAGGHLALMTAWAPENLAFGAPELRGYSSAVNGVIDIFGPTDIGSLLYAGVPQFIVKKKAKSKEYIEFREILLNAFTKQSAKHPKLRSRVSKVYSPITYVKRAVPTIILHGDKDGIVPYEQSTAIYQELQKNGIATELCTFIGDDHGFPKLKPEDGKKWAERVNTFLQTYVK